MTQAPEKVIRVSRIGKVITVHYRDKVIGKYREDDLKAQEEVLEKIVDHVYQRVESNLREYLTENLPLLVQQISQPKKGWLSRLFLGL